MTMRHGGIHRAQPSRSAGHALPGPEEEMFERTDTPCAPWTVVRSNDKKRGRIAAFRWVLSVLDYPT
jgi:polyphosphate kinase 2 (PPK2 family)